MSSELLPPTASQASYLARLVAEKLYDPDLPELVEVFDTPQAFAEGYADALARRGQWNRRDVSKLIDELRARPAVNMRAAATTPAQLSMIREFEARKGVKVDPSEYATRDRAALALARLRRLPDATSHVSSTMALLSSQADGTSADA